MRYYPMTRKILGRPVMKVGVYVVDGLLIDTAPRNLRAAMQEVLDTETIGQIALTHHHEDHVGNAALAAQRVGNAPRIHAAGVNLVERAPHLPLYRRVVWGTPDPVVAQPLGDTLETDSYRFDVIHTPGHAADHVALHEPEQEWVFAGDLFLTEKPRRAFAYEDIGELIASIRRLLAIPDCQLFCHHTGHHPSHQHRLGRRLDWLLGLQSKAVVYLEEGRSVRDIARAVGVRDGFNRTYSRGEWTGANLVKGLLRDAGKLP